MSAFFAIPFVFAICAHNALEWNTDFLCFFFSREEEWSPFRIEYLGGGLSWYIELELYKLFTFWFFEAYARSCGCCMPFCFHSGSHEFFRIGTHDRPWENTGPCLEANGKRHDLLDFHHVSRNFSIGYDFCVPLSPDYDRIPTTKIPFTAAFDEERWNMGSGQSYWCLENWNSVDILPK